MARRGLATWLHRGFGTGEAGPRHQASSRIRHGRGGASPPGFIADSARARRGLATWLHRGFGTGEAGPRHLASSRIRHGRGGASPPGFIADSARARRGLANWYPCGFRTGAGGPPPHLLFLAPTPLLAPDPAIKA